MLRVRGRWAAASVLALFAGMLVSIGVTTAPAATAAPPACASETPDVGSAAAMAKRCGQRVEVLSGRSEAAQVFANPDGSSTFTSSPVPVRVHRPDGSWVPVDTTLRVRPDGSVAPVATVTEMVFSGGGSGPFATYRDKGSTLTVGLPWSLPKPSLSGSTAVYGDVIPGVDLRVTASAASFRHVLVVKTAAAAADPALADLRLSVGGNVAAAPAGEGRVRFADAKGRTIAVSEPAAMWDSTVNPGGFGEVKASTSRAFLDGLKAAPPAELVSDERGPGATSRSAPVGVAADPDGHGVRLTPDAAMLKSAVLPLFIDPAIGPTDSAWAYTRSTNSNYTMNGQAWVGMNPPCCGGDGSLFRAFFDFPTTSGGLTYRYKHILSANFNITLTHSYSCGPTVTNAYGSQTSVYVANGARMDWNAAPLGSGVPWIGSAYGNANEAGGCGSIQPNMLMTFGNNEAMRADVQAAANKNWGIYTVGLCACDSNGANEGTQDRWKRFLVDPTTTMSVTFNSVPGTPANLSPHQGQVACGGVVGTTSPVLTAQYVDDDGSDTLSAVFHWQELPSGPVNSVNGSNAPANNFGSVTLNLGAGAEGKSYQFQVQTGDGYDLSPWSPWCQFTVDTTAPPGPVVTPTASGTAPVYVACDPASINTCTVRGGPGVAGAFTFSEPAGTAGQDVVKYVYGWDSPSITVTVSPGAASPAILLTPPHYGLNTLTAYSVDGTGHSSPITPLRILVGAPSSALASWPLDSIDGHGFTDQVSHNALTTTNVSWTNDARYIGAQAASFNGSTSEATQSVPAFDTSGSFSVSAWVRLTPTTCGSSNETAVSIDGDSVLANNHTSAFILGIDCANQRWRMVVAASNIVGANLTWATSANNSVVTGQWTHLVGTYDENANKISLWVNGTLAQTITTPPTWTTTHGTGWRATGNVVLGRWRNNDQYGGRWNGQIADVRLWNRVVVGDDVNGTNADPANGVPSQIGLASPLQAGAWAFPDGECFCANTLDGSVFSRPITVSPDFAADPNWDGNPTAAWLGGDGHDFNGEIQLDGVSGYATTTDDRGTLDTADDIAHPVLRTDQSFTVSAWVRLNRTDTYQMVVTQDDSVGSGWYLYYAPEPVGTSVGQWKLKMWPTAASTDNTNATYAVAPADNVTAYHHLVGVVDVGQRQVRLYVDGQLVGSSPFNAAYQPWQANGSLVIGRSILNGAFPNHLAGAVDDVTVWQGVLNAREIENLFSLGRI